MNTLNRAPFLQGLKEVWLPFVVTRLGVLTVGLLAVWLGPMRQAQGLWHASAFPWIDIWARWDSGYYLEIAAKGYSFVPGQMSAAAFFPLYPLLVRLVGLGTADRQSLTIAGWLVSNVSTWASWALLYRLVVMDSSEPIARRAIWLLALFPTGFFLSVVYTEGLFLFLTVAAFYCARRRWWLVACILGGLSAATRTIGVLVILPLAYEWWRQPPHTARSDNPRWTSAVWLLLIPVGLIAFMVYLELAFGNPLTFLEAHSAWGRVSTFSGLMVRARELGAARDLPIRVLAVGGDLFFAVIGCVLLFAVLRGQRLSYQVYTAYAILVPLATLQVMSISRCLLVAFPAFIFLAEKASRPAWYHLLLILFGVAQAFFVARWSLWYWVA